MHDSIRHNAFFVAAMTLAAFAACLATGPLARADLFRMTAGNTIEGQVIEDRGDVLRVRVITGIIDIKKAEIVARTAGLTPWEQYEIKRQEAAETAKDQFALAEWCRKAGLRDKERIHLQRTLDIDPDHEKARAALGYRRVNGRWTMPSPEPAAKQKTPASSPADEQTMLRELITKWFIKVRALHRGKLDCKSCGPDSAPFREGRARILAIHDPLAIPALTGVLSGGKPDVRELLVEALSKFDADEATMNLIVMSLLDPSREVRRLAARELIHRRDDRVVARLRDALNSDEEPIIRRAASALGILHADEAVEDLVGALSTKEVRPVRVTRAVFYQRCIRTFGSGTDVSLGNGFGFTRYQPGGIGVLDGGLFSTHDETELQVVDIYRTEVQEALIAVTGKNFGFDRAAWMNWVRDEARRVEHEAPKMPADDGRD